MLSTSSGFRDGLGERVLAFDRAAGELREQLRVRPELAAFEAVLGRQIDRSSVLSDPRFPRARDVDRDRATGQVVVVSDYVSGQRLSELLETAQERAVFPDMSAALQATGDLLLAVAAFSGSVKSPLGAIAPSRILITDTGKVVLTDYIFGPVLARLRFSPARLWRELGVLAGPDGTAFDEMTDVRQIALVLVALALGRPIGRDEFPHRAAALVGEACEVGLISGGDEFAAALRDWLEHALGSNGRPGFERAAQACTSFAEVMSNGLAGSRASLVSFLDDLAADPSAADVQPDPVAFDIGPRDPLPFEVISPASSVVLPVEATEEIQEITEIEEAEVVEPVRPAPIEARDAFVDAPPEESAVSDPFGAEPLVIDPSFFEEIGSGPVEPAASPVEEPLAAAAAAAPVFQPVVFEPVFEPPAVVDSPVAPEEPSALEEPLALEETFAVEEAVADEEPLAIEEAAAGEEPLAVEEAPAATPAFEAPIEAVPETVPETVLPETAVPEQTTTESAWDEWGVSDADADRDSERSRAPAPREPAIFDPRDPPSPIEPASRKKKRRGRKHREPSAPAVTAPPKPLVAPPPPVQSTLAALAAMPEILPPGVVPMAPVARPAPPNIPPVFGPNLAPPPVPQPIRLKEPVPGTAMREQRSDESRPRVNRLESPDTSTHTSAPELFADTIRPDRALPSLGLFLKIAGAVIVLGIAGFAFSTLGRSAPVPKPGMLTVESTPAGSDVFVDGQLKGKTPITIPVDAGKHEVKLARRGSSRLLPVTIEPGKPHVERFAWADVRRAGGLRVSSTPPGATVYVDGKVQGQTPLELPDLGVGRHVVAVEGRGGSVRRTVRVTAGEQAVVDVELFSGFVKVLAPVELQLSVRGRSVGSSGSDPIMLPAGTHQILAANPGLGYRETHTVSVEPGQTKNLTIAPTGLLSLNAVPWAEVIIDGTTAGETPIANRSVPIGTHQIVFRHPQHGERRLVATVKHGQVTTVSADLTKP